MKRLLAAALIPVCLCGCEELAPKRNKADAQPGNQQAAAKKEQKQEKNKPRKRGSVFGRKTREILDLAEARKEGYSIVTQKDRVTDPVTGPLTVYGNVVGKVGSAGIQQWINAEKALNDKPPSYDELQQMMKEHPGLSLPALPYDRKYGYDAEAGAIVTLEKKESGG